MVTLIPIITDVLRTVSKDLETGRIRNQRKNWDYPDYRIKIGETTEKGSGNIESCYHLDSSERKPSNPGVKNLKGGK